MELGFAGEYTDAETGFQYLRARYYDPATGQFLTRDPIEAETREPYGYVGGNPLNNVDPAGLNKCEVGANPVRWLGNAGDCASDIARSEEAQSAKAVLNQTSLITSGLAAVSATAALLPTPVSPFLLAAAGVFELSSGITGGLGAAIDCADGGPVFGCASGIAGPGINLVAPRVFTQSAVKYGEKTANALNAALANFGFAANTASFASDRRARSFC